MRKVGRVFGVIFMIASLVLFSIPAARASAEKKNAFQTDGDTLVSYTGDEETVTVPEGIEIIGKDAFKDNHKVKKVVLANSVKKIEPYAFWGCDSLKEISFGKNLKQIDDYAFANAIGIEQMQLPSTVEEIGIYAFEDCSNLTDMTIPYTVYRIHSTAFDGCTKVEFHCEEGSAGDKFAKSFYENRKDPSEYEDITGGSILPGKDNTFDKENNGENEDKIPSSENKTDSDSSSDSSLLGQVQVVQNQAVVFIDNSSFPVYGSGHEKAETGDEIQKEYLASEILEGRIPKYSIVDNEVIADGAYYRRTGIGDVLLPDTIREIGEFAFARSDIKSVVLDSRLETIAYGAFYHCNELNDVRLSPGVLFIEPRAFEFTPWLTDFMDGKDGSNSDFLISEGALIAYRGNGSAVDIPEGVRTIAAQCFKNHDEIKSVRLPSSLICVGEEAFMGCRNLTGLFWGSNEKYIKDRAFYDTELSGVKLPDSIETIGYDAFSQNTRITFTKDYQATVENTTHRLSNAQLRHADQKQEGSLEIVGRLGCKAALEESKQDYKLSINEISPAVFEQPFKRNLDMDVPVDAVAYELELTDQSGITINKLGKKKLSLYLPLHSNWENRELKAVITDRNGQLNSVPVKKLKENEKLYGMVELTFLSKLCLYPAGETTDEAVYEFDTDIMQLSAPTAVSETRQEGLPYPWLMLVAGGGLFGLSFVGKRK